MRIKLIAVAVIALFVIGGASVASADNVLVTASVLNGGTRVITSVPASMSLSEQSAGSFGGTLAVVVEEIAAPAPAVNNPWSVTARMAGDMTTVSGDSIASSALTLTPDAGLSDDTNIVGSVSMTVGPAGQSLAHTGTAATLFSVSGETTGTLYTGLYTGVGTINMTIPSGTKTGTYTGTLTITLVQ